MDLITLFFGRFHPLLVHLPIGILFLAFLFEIFSRFRPYKKLRFAVQPALFLGCIFAVASSISGYCLSQEGGYDDALLKTHQNFGIATAVFALTLYFFRVKSVRNFKVPGKRKWIPVLLFLPLIALLSITGHLGGALTHGEEYLFEFTAAAEKITDPAEKITKITNMDEALLYNDVVQPILESKCYSCHSAKKIKGELRLDRIEFIESGGKHGAIIEPGVPDSSSLYSRLMLPQEDKEHMPPKEKSQVSSAEIALIQSWIEEGANFEKKINTYTYAAKIKKYIHSIIAQKQQDQLIPEEEVSPADNRILEKLKAKGVLILPIGNETNYLSVSFLNARRVTDAELQLLTSIKNQLVWLNLGRTNITDEGLETMVQLPQLRQLHLDYTQISDQGVKHLSTLTELRYLNLVSTKVTDGGLTHLKNLKKMQKLFLYQTQVTTAGLKDFTGQVPKTEIVSGSYSLPKLASDTIVFKMKI